MPHKETDSGQTNVRRRLLDKLPQEIRAMSNKELMDDLNEHMFLGSKKGRQHWYTRPRRRILIQEAHRRGLIREDPGTEGGDLNNW